MCFSIEFNKHSLTGEEKKQQKKTGSSWKEEMEVIGQFQFKFVEFLKNFNTITFPVCFVVWVCCVFDNVVVVVFWFWVFFNKIIPLNCCAFGAH